MSRRISLTIATSEDGTKCDAECPHHDYVFSSRDDFAKPAYSVCSWNDPHRQQEGGLLDVRHPACIEAEEAMHEALSAENANARGIRGIYEGS